MSPSGARILLEMRAALDGHAGIPQETRLLFRGLSMLEAFEVEGLLQSSGHVLARGLPAQGSLARDREVDQLARVVVSIQQSVSSPVAHAVAMMARQALGGSEALTRFDAKRFRDFIWRRLFARTLPHEDFERVTAAGFRIARVPWTAMHRCALATRPLGFVRHPRIDTSGFDVLIAETPFPGRVSPGTRLVVRYHDAIPLLMPHTISDRKFHQASHYQALRANVRDGAHFACVSDATRNDLLSIFPEAEPRALTIHNMVSHSYFDEPGTAPRVPEIVAMRRHREGPAATGRRPVIPTDGAPFDYLLTVATLEPRKNHATLVSAWETLRARRFPNLKLVMVGALGWDHEAIVERFLPWMERRELFVLGDVPAAELRALYKHARATVSPSFYEGFDFSGVEAMLSGGAVAASDIPVHREVYGDAAEYFNPYSTESLAGAVTALLDEAASPRRAELVARGAERARRYAPEAILPQWESLLQTLIAARRTT